MAYCNHGARAADTAADLVGVILAGGQARRLGGRDKGSLILAGRPLIEHVASRLGPQVSRLAVSSNRPHEVVAATGLAAFADAPGLCGPAAGIVAALRRWPSCPLVAVAVDLPLLPRDLAGRLRAGQGDALCAYAVSAGGHALAVAFRPYTARIVERLLYEKEMRIGALLAATGIPVAFAPTGDEDIAVNINTWDDYFSVASQLGQGVVNSARMSAIA